MRARSAGGASVLSLAALAIVTLPGCGPRSGFVRDASTATDHQFRMDVTAQRYLRSVSGSASIGSLFCLIPLGNGAYRDAMIALHAQAKLETNEVLENVREDHALVPLLLYCADNLVISADVYEVISAAHPIPSDASEPSVPREPPPSPRPASSTPATEAPPRVSDPALCERAYPRLSVDLPSAFYPIFPYAKFIDAPAKEPFVAACREQADDVQICLQATFLRADLEGCRHVFHSLTPDQTKRLFGTFLREW